MSEIIQRSKQDAEQVAASMGQVCFFPQTDEIFLDLDTNKTGREYSLEVESTLCNNDILILGSLDTKSKNGNRHRYLKINRPLTSVERITVQACLGSDPVKEILSLLRCITGGEKDRGLL